MLTTEFELMGYHRNNALVREQGKVTNGCKIMPHLNYLSPVHDLLELALFATL